MKIKKYIGDTVQEAMDSFKNDLGSNGVILTTKTIRDEGILGLFKRPKIEITAAYQEKNDDLSHVKEDILDLKSLVLELSRNINQQEELADGIKKYLRILVKNGVDYNIAFNILKSISEKVGPGNENEFKLLDVIKHELIKIIGKNLPIEITNELKTIFFIGPTGVGKTTTLAKIASSLVLEQKYSIGLITTDTYRVGAVDQLKIYSDILKLPLEISYNEKDFTNAYRKFSKKDIVLVDTAGRNYNDSEHINQLESILDFNGKKDIFVLISATSDIRLLETLAVKYNFLGDYKIVVTKVDESDNLGSILNIKYLFDKEIAYYTTGQAVPEDISTVDGEYIVDMLVKEM